MSFQDLGLSPELLRAIEESGYTQPTPIQETAIPLVLMGRDVLGSAQTGTGKTASFTLPMIEILAAGRARARMPRSLILTPTRELAAQVEANFTKYGKYHRLSTALLVGGESVNEQKQILNRGVHVLIATPGRLLDLFERGALMLNDIKILVLDECDRMLDMGFIPDIERICSILPQLRQTLMFSATLPKEIRRLADQFLSNPKEVSVAPPAAPAALVTQHLSIVDDGEKSQVLRNLLEVEDVKNAFIFCNRKRDVARLFESLKRYGLDVGALHGDMSQPARTETLRRFKDGEITLLVCSDVAARGLDVKGLSHVFNFDVPMNAEDYVHRIGRTGRAGQEGRAFTIAAPEDGKYIQAIEELTNSTLPRLDVEGFETEELVFSKRARGRGRGKPSEKPSARADKPAKAAKPKSAPKTGAKSTPSPAPAMADAEPEPKPRGKQPARSEDSRGAKVVGFGDDVPGFMQGG